MPEKTPETEALLKELMARPMTEDARKAAARAALRGVVDRIEGDVAVVETDEGFEDVPADGLTEGQELRPEKTPETEALLKELQTRPEEPITARGAVRRLFRRRK